MFKLIRGLLKLGLAVVLIGGMIWGAVILAEKDPGRSGFPAPRPPTRRATPLPPANTPEGKLHRLLERRLGESNRGVARVESVKLSRAGHRVVQIKWAVNSNLTNSLIRAGALREIVKILRAVQDSGIEYGGIVVKGTFPAINPDGTSDVVILINASFWRKQVDKVAWERFLPENLPVLAESWTEHPALR